MVAPGLEAAFDIDPAVKWALQRGLDEIGLTLQGLTAIEAFETTRPRFKPVLTTHEQER